MKLVVSENCVGHGQCYRAAPNLLDYDEDGFVSIRGSSIEVPDDQTAFAHDAQTSCPEDAISLSD